MSLKKLITAVILVSLIGTVVWIRSLGAPDSPPVITLSATDVINASPDEVWALISDFEGYSQWNPYLTKIEGAFKVGETVSVTLVDANFEGPFVVKPRMFSIESGKSFSWKGQVGIQGVMDTHHVFAISETEDGNTQIHQYEEFRGLIAKTMADKKDRHANTQHAFAAMHSAIKAELEN
ncbi:MAG: SRPBCC family protein [Halioglobus sp.]